MRTCVPSTTHVRVLAGHEVTSGYWGLHVGHRSVWDAPCAVLTCLPGLLKMCHRAGLLSPEIFEGSEPSAMNSFWLLGSRSLSRSGWEGLCWPSPNLQALWFVIKSQSSGNLWRNKACQSPSIWKGGRKKKVFPLGLKRWAFPKPVLFWNSGLGWCGKRLCHLLTLTVRLWYF